jgi:hypothetical protein
VLEFDGICGENTVGEWIGGGSFVMHGLKV